MPPSYFPLRWESTGDQWWFASPIDWAAANGLYDVVRELLHLDTNLLIKLTSLRRIRRLETVWDDEAQFDDVAKCRSQVAKQLLLESETKRGENSLIRAGYGGWLLYTAASAGDLDFVMELLQRDSLLVFGEGEYGATDILYAAARSKSSEVFRLLLDFAISPRCCLSTGEESEERLGETEITSTFKWDMINRAVHAAARGGNLDILKELLGDRSDILGYRDAQGSTVLHSAASRGQIEVVKNLAESFNIISSTDSQGNTALHVAAYKGYISVVEFLILASPSLTSLSNNCGNSFLHMAVAGFRTPGFRRLDRQIELMKQLISGKLMNIQDIINVRNNGGRTILHMAVTENVQCNLVELLMSVPSIDLNTRDADGMTALDLLKQCPQSASSEILIKQMISAGGITDNQDYMMRSALISQLKMQGIGSSPGTSFRIPDAEIFLYTGMENVSDISFDQTSGELNRYSGELSHLDSADSPDNKKLKSANYAARRLKFLLRWARRKEKRISSTASEDGDSEFFEAKPIPLRQRYSRTPCLLNNNRTSSHRSSLPSPSSKKKFTAGLMHGVIKGMPHLASLTQSPSSPLSGSSVSSYSPMDYHKDMNIVKGRASWFKQDSFNRKLMNQYFCFGAQGLAVAVEDPINCKGGHQNHKHFSSLVA